MDLNDIIKNPEDIKKLISALQALIPKEDDSDPEPVLPKKKTKKDIIKKNKSTNKFLDMPERNSHKEDCKIDNLLSKSPPTERRPGVTTVDVVCRVCGKKYNINKSLLFEGISRYKCNNCSTQPG